ncbi:hypothetical protein HY26_18425 [Hyphomonas sp. GM-8P]|nr:hypothetical protein HY26_18425 [Hyphomonas sp. GM-8P]
MSRHSPEFTVRIPHRPTDLVRPVSIKEQPSDPIASGLKVDFAAPITSEFLFDGYPEIILIHKTPIGVRCERESRRYSHPRLPEFRAEFSQGGVFTPHKGAIRAPDFVKPGNQI